jgi:hypothetical protein
MRYSDIIVPFITENSNAVNMIVATLNKKKLQSEDKE